MINFLRILSCAIFNTLKEVLDTDAGIWITATTMSILFVFAPLGGFASLFIFYVVDRKNVSIGAYVLVVTSIICSILAAIYGDWSLESLDRDVTVLPIPGLVLQMLSAILGVLAYAITNVFVYLSSIFVDQYRVCKTKFLSEKDIE